jgi:quercetin dioxygenase-like cupin family protein
LATVLARLLLPSYATKVSERCAICLPKKEKYMNTEKNPTTGLTLDVFGPTVEYLTLPNETQDAFCVLKGTIPPGGVVPLHSHPDVEDFVVISGQIQALRQGTDGHEWIVGKAGDYFHVPSNAPHAWRNASTECVVTLIFTTPKLGRFFQEWGRPMTSRPQPPTPEELARFAAISARYGYWNATPEENTAVGIHLSF